MIRNSVGTAVLLSVFWLAPASISQDYWAVCFPREHGDWQPLISQPNGFCFHYPDTGPFLRMGMRLRWRRNCAPKPS
jgi:hypothetical protein